MNGTDVKKIRKNAGLTQTQLAIALGVTANYVLLVEKGKRNLSAEKSSILTGIAEGKIDPKKIKLGSHEYDLDHIPDELERLIPEYEEEQYIIRKIQHLSGWLSERDMWEGMTKTARKLLDEYFAEHAGEKFKTLKNAMEDLLAKTSNKETVATCIRILDEIRSAEPSVDRLLSRMWLGMKLPPRK